MALYSHCLYIAHVQLMAYTVYALQACTAAGRARSAPRGAGWGRTCMGIGRGVLGGGRRRRERRRPTEGWQRGDGGGGPRVALLCVAIYQGNILVMATY